jgi:uncharacterized protein YukE
VTTTGPTQHDTSFIDWQDEVEDMLEQLEDKIQEGVDWVLDQWDGSILDSWLKYTSPAVYAAGKYALDKLEEAIERIWDEFERILPEVWDQVRRLFATPWGLMDLNQRYSEAAGKLRDEELAVDRLTRHIQKGWSGDAWTAYHGVATEQKKAILAVNTGLTSAASACATGARQIWSTWQAVVDTILNIASKVVAAIKDGTDAGQWVTLDAGPAIKVIGDVAIEVLRLANKLLGFWADNTTVNLAVWTGLNDGLVGLGGANAWPDIDSYDRDDLRDKGGWNHS